MKKIKFFSFASAVLLASAAGMTSCSSDSIEPTGGSGVAGQVVKTQWFFSNFSTKPQFLYEGAIFLKKFNIKN